MTVILPPPSRMTRACAWTCDGYSWVTDPSLLVKTQVRFTLDFPQLHGIRAHPLS